MKLLLIIIVLAFAAAFIYVRVRPYVATARRVLGFVRDARNLAASAPSAAPPRGSTRAAEKLVRCSSCGTWLPDSRAISHRNPSSVFCSHECLERAADTREPRRKSAS